MDYYDIPRYLKRYKFEEKMRILNYYSSKLLTIDGRFDMEDIQNLPHPWELETLLIFSLKATPEYAYNEFDEKNTNIFINMVNLIRMFDHPILSKEKDDSTLLIYHLSVLGLCQFDVQEYLPYKYYRYSFIFNFQNEVIDMKSLFKDKYGISYYEFLRLGTILNLMIGSNLNLNQEIFEYILRKECPNAFSELVIDYKEYITQIDNITSKQEDYLYCLRPSYKYPFVERDNHVYLPLPHLLGRSVTSSLLYRITDNDNNLRALIGKEVLENYLFRILLLSNAYDEIIPEQQYKSLHNNRKRTLDVMIRKDNKFLLVDSKSSVPGAKLRIFDEKVFLKEIDKISDNIVQVYNHITHRFPNEYNYFKFVSEVNCDNIYGLVVVLEDNFIFRQLIYDKASQKLEIDKSESKYRWLINHVKLVSLYDVERTSFTGISIIDLLENQKDNDHAYDFPLIEYNKHKEKIINKEYLEFKASWLNIVSDFAEHLKSDNIIN